MFPIQCLSMPMSLCPLWTSPTFPPNTIEVIDQTESFNWALIRASEQFLNYTSNPQQPKSWARWIPRAQLKLLLQQRGGFTTHFKCDLFIYWRSSSPFTYIDQIRLQERIVWVTKSFHSWSFDSPIFLFLFERWEHGVFFLTELLKWRWQTELPLPLCWKDWSTKRPPRNLLLKWPPHLMELQKRSIKGFSGCMCVTGITLHSTIKNILSCISLQQKCAYSTGSYLCNFHKHSTKSHVTTGAPAYEALYICTSTLSGASAGIRGHHVSRRLFWKTAVDKTVMR